MHWEHGHKAVEEFKVGDRLYARDEFDPNGPMELKAIEEVFVRQGIVLELTVGGQVIGTTAEHPFYAYGRGWTPAHELTVGELIATADGRWLPIEKSYNTGNLETVYNFRIADHHTYFVGDSGWGFAVWAHNSYSGNLNSNDAKARFGIYELDVNGELYKVGKAHLDRVTISSGLPTRVHQQVRKLEKRFGIGSVTPTIVDDLGMTTTARAKAVESGRLQDIYDSNNKFIPEGNRKSFKPL